MATARIEVMCYAVLKCKVDINIENNAFHLMRGKTERQSNLEYIVGIARSLHLFDRI